MSETRKELKRVGNYSMQVVEPDACSTCHAALWGTVIIDNICLECRFEEIAEKLLFAVDILEENSKCLPGCKCAKCLSVYALSVIGELDECIACNKYYGLGKCAEDEDYYNNQGELCCRHHLDLRKRDEM